MSGSRISGEMAAVSNRHDFENRIVTMNGDDSSGARGRGATRKRHNTKMGRVFGVSPTDRQISLVEARRLTHTFLALNQQATASDSDQTANQSSYHGGRNAHRRLPSLLELPSKSRSRPTRFVIHRTNRKRRKGILYKKEPGGICNLHATTHPMTHAASVLRAGCRPGSSRRRLHRRPARRTREENELQIRTRV